MDLVAAASAEFERVVEALPPDAWDRTTPADVTVRELVDHVVAGNLFATRLLSGVPRDEARAVLEGDHLGEDPMTAVRESCVRQAAAFADVDRAFPVPHHQGDLSVDAFLRFRLVDLVVHSWDVARGAGLDERLDPDVVGSLWDLVEPHLAEMLSFGAYGEGPSGALPADAPLQVRLLDAFGRRP